MEKSIALLDLKQANYVEYLQEILRAEGFSSYMVLYQEELQGRTLEQFSVVLLPSGSLVNDHQASQMRTYVANGGCLVALRPLSNLGDLFGIEVHPNLDNTRYLVVLSHTPMAMQFRYAFQVHGEIDVYSLNCAMPLAFVCTNDRQHKILRPAITVCQYGLGFSIAIAFDLALNVLLTRQGNPARSSTLSHGLRMDPGDLFVNHVLPTKVELPQADLQMQLLRWLLSTFSKLAIPRLWYYPTINDDLVVIMTGDTDDASIGQIEDLLHLVEQADGHMTLYALDDSFIDVETYLDWTSERGHELSVHPFSHTLCLEGLRRVIEARVESFEEKFGERPRTVRNHQLQWVGFTEPAQIMQDLGIAMDLNFASACPGIWFGYMNGSGFPIRFCSLDGKPIDVYQQPTHFEDDVILGPYSHSSSMNPTEAFDVTRDILANSRLWYHTPLCFNIHPINYVRFCAEWADQVLHLLRQWQVSILTAKDWLDFWRWRNQIRISEIEWNEKRLSFNISWQDNWKDTKPALAVPSYHRGMRLLGAYLDGLQLELGTRTIDTLFGRETLIEATSEFHDSRMVIAYG